MEHNSQRDAEQAAITTSEHQSLGNVLDVVRRLEELRSRGLSSAQMAERIRLTHPNRPGGGPWSAEAVTRVLEIADASRSRVLPEATGQPVTLSSTPWTPPPATPAAPPNVLAGESGRAVDPAAEWYPPPPARPAPQLDHRDQRAPLRVQPRRYHRRPAARLEPTQGSDTGRRRLLAGLLTVIGVVAAGGALALAVTRGDMFDRFTAADQAATTLAPETTGGASPADEQPTSDETDIDRPTTDGEGAPGRDDRPPETGADDVDSLVIRIEPSTPEPGDGIAPASATIRTDGKLYVEGAFRSESEAQRYLEAAAGVFGEAALVPEYTIDPAAPDPAVSDVVLEKPVLFESGSAEIDPEYLPFLEACGDVLKMNSHIVMSVTAFTDASGSAQFNLELSQRRADAVIDFYRNLDIGEDQLISTGFGESDFVADNSTEEGRQQNRRAMLELLDVIKDS